MNKTVQIALLAAAGFLTLGAASASAAHVSVSFGYGYHGYHYGKHAHHHVVTHKPVRRIVHADYPPRRYFKRTVVYRNGFRVERFHKRNGTIVVVRTPVYRRGGYCRW